MKTIFCPTDFSTAAEYAVDYAYNLAVVLRSRLILFHSIYNPAAVHSISTESPVEELLWQDRLDALCKKLQRRNPEMDISYQQAVADKHPAIEIAHDAEKQMASLLLVGSTKEHRMATDVTASVSLNLLEISKYPVLIIPEGMVFTPLKKIVFAIDLLAEPVADLPFVRSLAEVFQAELMILHVLKEYTHTAKSNAHLEYLQKYKHIRYDNASFHTIEATHVEVGILEFVHEMKTDLLVMVSRPKSFMEYVYNKSHTRKIAQRTPVPLLAIHA